MPRAWWVLEVRSTRRVQVIDITEEVVGSLAPDAGGALLLITPHTTAALLVNEYEPGLMADVEAWLERFAPRSQLYAHNRVDDNADAHLRAIALGPSLVVPVEEGNLLLGTWQRILFVELDGPRTRQVRMRLID